MFMRICKVNEKLCNSETLRLTELGLNPPDVMNCIWQLLSLILLTGVSRDWFYRYLKRLISHSNKKRYLRCKANSHCVFVLLSSCTVSCFPHKTYRSYTLLHTAGLQVAWFPTTSSESPNTVAPNLLTWSNHFPNYTRPTSLNIDIVML